MYTVYMGGYSGVMWPKPDSPKKKSPENTFIRNPLPGDFPALFWPRFPFSPGGRFCWRFFVGMCYLVAIFYRFYLAIFP